MFQHLPNHPLPIRSFGAEAVGGVPTSVTATEAYNAMESGVVDTVALGLLPDATPLRFGLVWRGGGRGLGEAKEREVSVVIVVVEEGVSAAAVGGGRRRWGPVARVIALRIAVTLQQPQQLGLDQAPSRSVLPARLAAARLFPPRVLLLAFRCLVLAGTSGSRSGSRRGPRHGGWR